MGRYMRLKTRKEISHIELRKMTFTNLKKEKKESERELRLNRIKKGKILDWLSYIWNISQQIWETKQKIQFLGNGIAKKTGLINHHPSQFNLI